MVIEPVPVTGFAANFSPMPRIAPPPLGKEIEGAEIWKFSLPPALPFEPPACCICCVFWLIATGLRQERVPTNQYFFSSVILRWGHELSRTRREILAKSLAEPFHTPGSSQSVYRVVALRYPRNIDRNR